MHIKTSGLTTSVRLAYAQLKYNCKGYGIAERNNYYPRYKPFYPYYSLRVQCKTYQPQAARGVLNAAYLITALDIRSA
jgi:hypothetical protein